MSSVPRPTVCKTCGAPITQARLGSPRLYCSAKCRHVLVEERRRKRCSVPGCGLGLVPGSNRGLCQQHLDEAKVRGDFNRLCSVDGCSRAVTSTWNGVAAKGLCGAHLIEAKKSGTVPTRKRKGAAVCALCGRPLPYRRRRLCSEECARAWKDAYSDTYNAATRAQTAERRAVPVPCKECGKPVSLGPVGRPLQFCDLHCRSKFHTRRRNRSRPALTTPQPRQCILCGSKFEPKHRNQVYCCQKCYRRGNRQRPRFVAKNVDCANCGATFVARRHDHRFCSFRCGNRFRGREASRGFGSPAGRVQYSDIDIFERDGWRCQLCGKKVRKDRPRTHPDGASIDHRLPLSEGGSDEPANVQLAHLRCNIKKNSGVWGAGEQIRLL